MRLYKHGKVLYCLIGARFFRKEKTNYSSSQNVFPCDNACLLQSGKEDYEQSFLFLELEEIYEKKERKMKRMKSLAFGF